MIDIKFFYLKDYEYQRKIPSHNHSIYEFVFYNSGEGKGIVENKEYYFSDNSFIIIPPPFFHEETHFGSSKVFIVGFEAENLNLSLMTGVASSTVIKLLTRMKDEKMTKQMYYKNCLNSLFEECIISILRNNKIEESKDSTSSIENAVSYIDQYFNTDINLDELAKESGYCTDRFRNLFKDEIGETPKKYILNKRLNLAKKLILENKQDMNEISILTGFKSYIRFSLFFKEQTGMSPYEYQKKYTK